MRKLKILHVINSFDPGGNERFVLQLLEHLNREKFPQQVCIPDRGKDMTLFLKDVCDRLGIKVDILKVRSNFDLTIHFKLKKLMKAEKYDIVHTHLIFSQIWGRRAARAAGVPTIISSEQNPYPFKTRPPFSLIERRLSKYTKKILACSEKVKDHLIQNVGIDPEKVITVHNSVDTSSFFPMKESRQNQPELAKLREELGFSEGDKVIGTVGHLTPQKGHEYLFRAGPKILESIPQARFLVVGKGYLKRKLENLARSLGISDEVVFAGLRQDIPLILNSLDLFVLPSLWEGFGIAIIEAMACAVPVIASNVGGIPEIVQHGENGILIAPKNPDEIVSAVIRVLKNKELADRLAENGMETVKEKFEVEKMVRRVEQVYEESC